MKTANLKVIFQTNDIDQLLENFQTTITPIYYTNAIQPEDCSDILMLATYHTTDIKETLAELAAYPDTFINRAMYLDETQSYEENETAKAWIATTLINQFNNRHKTIYYRNGRHLQPISSVSDYLESKDFKNGIIVTQTNSRLYCKLYGQTDEKDYLFEAKNLHKKETNHENS